LYLKGEKNCLLPLDAYFSGYLNYSSTRRLL